MRIARVIGTVTLGRQVPSLKPGRYLIAEALDGRALAGLKTGERRAKAMPESLIVFDNLGAGLGQLIAVTEGYQARQPFGRDRVPLDAFNAAILDQVEWVASK